MVIVGKDLHEDPQIPNFGKVGEGLKLVEGSEGGVRAKTGIRVKMRSPDWVVPWKEPSAVSGPPAR